MWSVEYRTGLFVCGVEIWAHLVVEGMCVEKVYGGGLRCWGLGVVCVCNQVSV